MTSQTTRLDIARDRHHSWRSFVSRLVCVMAAIAASSVSSARGADIKAYVSASWWASFNTPPLVAGTAKGDSEFSLGNNEVKIGSGNTVEAKRSYAYKDSLKGLEATRGIAGENPSGRAYSEVNPRVQDRATNLYSYDMLADVYAYPEFFGPGVTSTAIAADPQLIDLPGFFEQTITLRAGSALFVSPDGLRSGSALGTFPLTADGILSDPMVAISLSMDLSGINVAVTFNSDERLHFFEPGTTIPISSGSVRALLLSHPELFSEAGLTSDLSLFTVSLDLSSTFIPEGAALGSQAISIANATAVPESASLVLSALGGLIVLASVGRFRRVAQHG